MSRAERKPRLRKYASARMRTWPLARLLARSAVVARLQLIVCEPSSSVRLCSRALCRATAGIALVDQLAKRANAAHSPRRRPSPPPPCRRKHTLLALARARARYGRVDERKFDVRVARSLSRAPTLPIDLLLRGLRTHSSVCWSAAVPFGFVAAVGAFSSYFLNFYSPITLIIFVIAIFSDSKQKKHVE